MILTISTPATIVYNAKVHTNVYVIDALENHFIRPIVRILMPLEVYRKVFIFICVSF